MRIEVINGPNLNLLGSRETSIYGSASLADIESELRAKAGELDAKLELEFFQSNHEGEIISRIQESGADGIILNAAAFTHTSVGIRDGLAAKKIPFIEVHISNISAREDFRHKSYLSDIAAGVIFGFGTYGYSLALDGLYHHVKNRSNS